MREAPAAQPGCRAAACEYLARGWSVIPIEPRGKRPLVAWLEFQNRLPSAAEVARWFGRWPEANVGMVTGAVSGLVAPPSLHPSGKRYVWASTRSPDKARPAPLPLWLTRLVGQGGHPLAHWRELVRRRIPEEVARVVESIARIHERRYEGAPD